MITYILKSSLSLLVLFGLYWFLLRKEKTLVFNRFFLIFSIIFSLIIPFIAIPVNIEDRQLQNNLVTVLNSNIQVFNSNPSETPDISTQTHSVISVSAERYSQGFNLFKSLIILYFSVVILLLFRFIKNILFISNKLKLAEKINYSGFRIVLLDNQVSPFCFFKAVFVYKYDYLNNRLSAELLEHEFQHIKQSHSIDVIFVELVQIIYWFNPVLILYNRAVRVNHEYLADNSVVQLSSDIKSYAENLINFVSYKKSIPLTSGFNQSLTRKRLVMLTKANPHLFFCGLRIFFTLSITAFAFLFLSWSPTNSQNSTEMKGSAVFNGLQSQKIKDIDGNEYKTVKIGFQVWMAENLKTTRYNDGREITLAADEKQWQEFNSAYCWYDNNEKENKDRYGALYNWYAVNTNKLCPAGWHVPTVDEVWYHLFDYLSNKGYGNKNSEKEIAKSLASAQGWNTDSGAGNIGFDQVSNNSSGFNGIPVGYRDLHGEFSNVGRSGFWWTSSDYNISLARAMGLESGNSRVNPLPGSKRNGFSVRCLKNYSKEDIITLKKQRDSALTASKNVDFSGVWHLKKGMVFEGLIPSELIITQQANTVTLNGTFDFIDKKPVNVKTKYTLNGKETITRNGGTKQKVSADWGRTKSEFYIATVRLSENKGSKTETKCIDHYIISSDSSSLQIYFEDYINPQWVTYIRTQTSNQ